MNKSKRTSIWVIGIMGCLAALLLVLSFLLPRLINLEGIKEKVQSTISQEVKGEVKFQEIDLSLFPRPVVGIHQISMSIPGNLSGKIESVAVFPEILPLLQGKVRIAALHFEAPHMEIVLPEKGEERGEGVSAFSPERIRERVASLGARGESALVVQIKKGALSLSEGEEKVLWFRDIQARINGSSDGLTFECQCASGLWESMSLQGRFNPTDLNGDGHISLKGFQPQDLTAPLPIPANYRFTKSLMDLEISLTSEKLETLSADIEGSFSSLVICRGDTEVVMRGKSLKATVAMSADALRISLTQLDLDHPRLTLCGNLRVDRLSPGIVLALEGKNVDAASIRDATFALAGEIPIVQRVFGIVKGGTIPLITFKTEGRAGADLKNLEHMVIRGSVDGGKIFLPEQASVLEDVSMDLQDIKADVVISRGVLEAENFQGRWENAEFREGALRMGLQGEDRPFHLEAMITTDLGQVPPLLKRIIKDSHLAKELAAVRDVKGKALGKLTIGERVGSLKTTVDVSQFNLTGRYERLPYSLKISEGQYSYNEKEILVSNLRGKLGESFFSGLTAKITLEKTPHLEISSGNLTLSLIQVHQWLSSFASIQASLKDLHAAQGTLILSNIRLKGPVSRPETWQFDAAGEVKNLLLDTAFCPSQLSVSRGKLRAKPGMVAFTNAQIGFLDTSLQASGTIYDFLEGASKADFTLAGKVGKEANQWIANLIRLPPRLKIRTPFLVSDGRVDWEKNGKSLFSGTIVPHEGPAVSLEVAFSPGEVALTQLLIKDEKSDAAVSFFLKERAFDFGFRGHVEKASIDRILVENQFLAGRIRGDLTGHVVMDEPVKSTAQGKLEGADLAYPLRLNAPVQPTIEDFSLEAKGNRVDVKSALVSVGGKDLNLNGRLDFSPEKLLIDMDVLVDGIEWGELQQNLKQKDKKRDLDARAEKVKGFPIEGVLKVKSESFKYKDLVWSPFHADVSLSTSSVGIAITEANFCGVSCSGEVHTTPEGTLFALRPVSQNQQLGSFLSCLFKGKEKATGEFDFQGSFTAQGKGDQLMKSLRGTGELLARDGRIYHDILLLKIYQYLNSTDVFRGEFRSIGKEGFAFETISVKVNLEGEKLVISEALMNGASMEMALKGTIDLNSKKIDGKALVAPVKTVDRVVKVIPVVRNVLGGTLITIPIRISGDLGSPKVTPLSPSMIGSDLLGTIKKVGGLPVKVIRPVIPKSRKTKDAPSKDE